MCSDFQFSLFSACTAAHKESERETTVGRETTAPISVFYGADAWLSLRSRGQFIDLYITYISIAYISARCILCKTVCMDAV